MDDGHGSKTRHFIRTTFNIVMNNFYFITSSFSMGLCALTFLTILRVKKLKNSHPNKMIAVIAAAEFITCWTIMVYNLDPEHFVCEYKLNELYWNSITLGGSIYPNYSKTDAVKTLVTSLIIIFDVS